MKMPLTSNKKSETCNQKLVYFAKNSNYLPQLTDTKPIGMPFIELQSVDSTNNYARQQIHAGLAQHGMAIFAHEQLSGKGQRGKTWSTEKDANIILSIILKPYSLLLSQQFMLIACVAVAVYDFFKKYAGDNTKIKWPNDLYWQDRKAGGILIESGVRSHGLGTGSQQLEVGSWHWAIIGIGVNINQTSFDDDLINPVSLKQITGKNFDTVLLAKDLCEILNNRLNQMSESGFEKIYNSYLSNLYKKDSLVKLKKGSQVFEATIRSVSQTGKLIVHPGSNGDIEEEFSFEEIEWLIK